MPLWAKAPPAPPGRLMKTLTGHTDTVEELAIAPDGTWLATAGNDNTARIWAADAAAAPASGRAGGPGG